MDKAQEQALLAKQVKEWRKEIARLNGLVIAAEGETPTVAPASGDVAALLQKIKNHYPQVDNGTCAVCRIGYRAYIKGNPGPCQNGSCLSHDIDKAIVATAAPATVPQGDVLLPCDVHVGPIKFGKGVKLQTLVDAATRWHKQASEAAMAGVDVEAARAALRLDSSAPIPDAAPSPDAREAKQMIGAYANIHPDEREKMTFGMLLKLLWRMEGAMETAGFKCAEILAKLLDARTPTAITPEQWEAVVGDYSRVKASLQRLIQRQPRDDFERGYNLALEQTLDLVSAIERMGGKV